MGQRLGNGIALFLSDVLVVGCIHIELVPWLLPASRRFFLLLARLINRQDVVFDE